MKDIDKLIKESLSFSEFEKLPILNEKLFEEKYFYYKEVGLMKGVGKILLVVSVVLIVAGATLFLVWDKLAIKGPVQQLSKVEVPAVKQPESISAKVTMVCGDVKVANMGEISDVEIGYNLKEGDVIQTAPDSECEVQVANKGLIKIAEKSSVSFSEMVLASQKTEREIFVISGGIKSAFKKLSNNETFKVKTDTAIAAVRGTKFSVGVDEKGKTKLIVSEGKVIFVPRVTSLEEIKESVKDEEVKAAISEIELKGGIVVEEGKKSEITPEMKSKAEENFSSVKKDVESIITQVQENPEAKKEVIAKVEKAVSDVSEKVTVKEEKAKPQEVKELDKVVSKELISVSDENLVKISFTQGSDEVAGSEVYIDNTLIGKVPLSKMLSSGKKYKLEVRKDNKVILSSDLSADKDMEIKVTLPGEESKVETPVEESFTSRDLDFTPNISYGKVGIYTSQYVLLPSYNSVLYLYGDSFKRISMKNFVSMGADKDMIAIISRNEDSTLTLRVYSNDGNLVKEIDLGDITKGLLTIGKIAVVSKKVIIPVLNGVGIVDVDSGNVKFINIGNTFSDIESTDNGAIVISEMGEIYKVNLDGSFSKVGQISIVSVRKATLLTHPDGSIYIVHRGKLYRIGPNKEVSSTDLGVSEVLGTIYGDKIVFNAGTRVLVINRNSGKIENTIEVSGKVNGIPYLKDKYLIITSSDGLYLYNLESNKEEKKYDVIGYSSMIKDNNIYVIGKSKMFIIPMK